MSESQSVAKSEQKPPQTGTRQVESTQAESTWHPLAVLRNEMDRMFDGFWRRMVPGAPLRRTEVEPQSLWRFDNDFGFAVPNMDLVETEKDFRIKAELPGMDASNVELAISGDVLTIKGEKKDEREEKAENFHLSERRFGSFRRSFQLHPGVDVEQIEAKFDKGVLTVTLPKTAESAARQRKIEVKSGS